MPNDGPRREDAPKCSIVIPVFNGAELTTQCLASIRENTNYPSYDVVIVDNGSSDGTADLLAGLEPPFRSIRNEENLGFARACNQGAAATAGEYVLFLNNDTEASPGWMSPLVDRLDRYPEVAIVGSKLLYPESDLIQHAGVVIGKRRPFHIYRRLPSDAFAVNQEREVDAVTAACALVRRSVFEELGGFDEAYVNGLEDVDLCLRTRELGYTSLYCPDSVLYHHESMTEGRMDHTGQNDEVFWARWRGRISPSQWEQRHMVAYFGDPPLKVNAEGDKFVVFHGRSLMHYDGAPGKTTYFSNCFSYWLARIYYSIRYVRYRKAMRELVEEAKRVLPENYVARALGPRSGLESE